MKKIVALFLVISLSVLSGNLYAKDRKGADLLIQKTDGQQIRGELIAVKENSLLLLESDSGADMSVDIVDIGSITIEKKSKLLLGAGLGLLGGAAAGALFGVIVQPLSYESGYYYVQGFYLGIIGALACGIIGGLVGAAHRGDKKIKFEGKSDSEIEKILEKLYKKARVKNFQ